VRLTTIADRIKDAARELSTPIEVRTRSLGTASLPTSAAESLYSAAVQAMVNSLAHAGEGVDRWVSIRGVRPGGVEIVVGDTGAGFDPTAVPGERLGVRVSIIERLANAGGRAVIRSAPGEGTLVSLRWPHSAEVVS
jgi:signal transduction histidine kinase